MFDDFARTGRKCVIGMVHLQPLPGTPFHREGTFAEIRDRAVSSALALRDGGADGCLVQTVDRVYSTADEADPTRTAALALIVDAVVQATGGSGDFRVGVQMMRNAVSASLGVARVAGGGFVRAGALVGATLSPQGHITPDPLRIAEYRRRIAAEDVAVVADVWSSHYRWLGGGKPVGEVARAARTAGADAVSLGDPDDERTLEAIADVRRSADGLPIILAGHTHHGNASRLLAAADGAFVGSCLERTGWGGPIDAEQVRRYVGIVRAVER